MLRRLARWSDSSGAGRRLRRVVIANPVSGGVIRVFDRRRMRRLEAEADLVERSKSRWRAAEPSGGLTWGEDHSGDAAAAMAAAHGVFGSGRDVLEVGPGYGRVLRSVLSGEYEFSTYTGLDLSENNVEHLRSAFPDERISFAHGDAEAARLHRPPDSVISFLMFKHLYPTFEAALANLAGQAAPGAVILFDLLEGERAYFHDDEATFIRHYTREEAGEIAERAGLREVAFDSVEHTAGRKRLVVVGRTGQP